MYTSTHSRELDLYVLKEQMNQKMTIRITREAARQRKKEKGKKGNSECLTNGFEYRLERQHRTNAELHQC